MTQPLIDRQTLHSLTRLAQQAGLDIAGGRLRRTSSRFCLGVEHGDYNGTELFGVGTDRFLWIAYKPNASGRVRLLSGNFPGDGLVSFRPGEVPPPRSPQIADTWARFPLGVDCILHQEGFRPAQGFDAVVFGNIPGGGMSRSASLTLNLLHTVAELNRLKLGKNRMRFVELAQRVENDYIGSPCGQLDQIMIEFARAGAGTHYQPATQTVKHVSLGADAPDFRIVCLDTGTVRPGLEKSTYRMRRAECEELAHLAGKAFGFTELANVRDEKLLGAITERFGTTHPDHCDRLRYLFAAQKRFRQMLAAWRAGDVATVGAIFRADGIGLRDQYRISGPELETMCDIARTVPGVYGERMLGGGDKGAAGALCAARAVSSLRKAVALAYPRSHPALESSWAVHDCRVVDGVVDGPFE